MNTVVFILGLVQLGFLSIIAYYLHQLKKVACECALTKPYQVLYHTIWVLIGVRVFLLAVELNANDMKRTLMPLIVFISLINLVFFITSIYFIIYLYKINCECSKNAFQLIYLIYAIIKVSWIIFAYITLAVLYISLAKLR
jgi:hypothetical protein